MNRFPVPASLYLFLMMIHDVSPAWRVPGLSWRNMLLAPAYGQALHGRSRHLFSSAYGYNMRGPPDNSDVPVPQPRKKTRLDIYCRLSVPFAFLLIIADPFAWNLPAIGNVIACLVGAADGTCLEHDGEPQNLVSSRSILTSIRTLRIPKNTQEDSWQSPTTLLSL